MDIRYAALRDRDGLIPGALIVERNELGGGSTRGAITGCRMPPVMT